MYICVKDMETLTEYETCCSFQRKFLKRFAGWIKKGKYTCLEHVTDDKLTLKVKIFTFSLQAKQQDDSSMLLNEIKLIKNERKSINKEIDLFQFFILNVFNEKDYR